MKKSSINNIIKAISIIDYVYAILNVLTALFLFLGGTVLASLGILSKLLPGELVGSLVGGALILTSLIILALGVLYFFLGKAISQHKKWAQIVQIIMGFFSLFSFPIGTAFGIFVIWALLINKEIKKLFK
ncbi:MAG: hypothetical protein AABX08_00015 [Nanoarchaeota archaeon]